LRKPAQWRLPHNPSRLEIRNWKGTSELKYAGKMLREIARDLNDVNIRSVGYRQWYTSSVTSGYQKRLWTRDSHAK
jgi:hypothetical protein